MPQTNPYTILSIGPIYDAFQVADNTRAMWTVSFMFSYLMRETIKKLITIKKDKDFLVPNITQDFEKYLLDEQRIGLFHDRLILKGEHVEVVNSAFAESVKELTQIIIDTFELTNTRNFRYVKIDYEKSKVEQYFYNYFQSYVAQVCVDANKSPLLELSKYVDAVENEPKLAPFEEEEYLFLFLRLTNLGLLQKTAFGEEAFKIEAERCFKSLPEIAAWELIKKQPDKWKKTHLCLKIDDVTALQNNIKSPDDEAKEILDALETDNKEIFKPYHKYVAIVHGDGDAFGKHLESIGNNEKEIKKFSDDIFKFITASRDSIRAYGGYPVVGSGEDLLFFAPVIVEDENIFTQINKIDKIFKGIFKNPQLSMSYGVSVSYYKFPLQEAMEISAKALWDEAKQSVWLSNYNLEGSIKKKNAIHINIQKHSGQSHELTLAKGTLLYTQFIQLLKSELNSDEKLHLPHALHHSLARVSTIIDTMPVENIEPFFTNMFNENIHQSKHKEALKAIQNILKLLKDHTYIEHTKRKYKSEDAKEFYLKPSETVFSMLSIIKLLRGDA